MGGSPALVCARVEGPRLHCEGLGRCRGRGDSLVLLLGCVPCCHTARLRAGQGKGARVPQHWGGGDRQSGLVRGQAGRTGGAALSCNLREGDTEARGFLSLFSHQQNCKSHRSTPLGRQPLLRAIQAAAAWAGGLGVSTQPWGCAGAWAASRGWNPSKPTHQPWEMPPCVPWPSQLCHPPSEDTKQSGPCWCGRCAGVPVVTTPGVGTGWDTCTMHLPCWASPSLSIPFPGHLLPWAPLSLSMPFPGHPLL